MWLRKSYESENKRKYAMLTTFGHNISLVPFIFVVYGDSWDGTMVETIKNRKDSAVLESHKRRAVV